MLVAGLSARRAAAAARTGADSVGQLAGDVLVHDASRSWRRSAVGQRLVQARRLGVDQVRLQLAGVAAEQRVRQRAVAPVEAGEMEPHEQPGHRVEQTARGSARARVVMNSVRYGQRRLEEARDQHARDAALADRRAQHARGRPASDRGQASPLEPSEQVVLALRASAGSSLSA